MNAVDPTGQFAWGIAIIVGLTGLFIGFLAGSGQIATNAISSRPKPKPDPLVVPNPYPNYYPSTPSLPKAPAKPKENAGSKSIPAKKPTSQYQYREAYRDTKSNQVVVGRGLSYPEARLRVAAQLDIMCINQKAAIGLVKFYPSAIGPERDRNKPEYYYHYHLSPDRKSHIWYYN